MRNKKYVPVMEICLCSRCAGIFYDSKDYYIERTNLYQIVLEPCSICTNPRGYDFIVRSRTQRSAISQTGGRFGK